jgi:hypothetical protein
MFQKQRDQLVLRKQAELNIIQKKAKVKKKFDGYDEALNRSVHNQFRLLIIFSYADFLK